MDIGTRKGWPLAALDRWPLNKVSSKSKTHWEGQKIAVVSRWPFK